MLNCKLKYVLFSLLCVFISPFIVKADCSYEREAELTRLASNVQLSYVYNEINGFTVYLTNLTQDLYAENVEGFDGNYLMGGKEYSFNYASGLVLKFNIYSNDSSCYGNLLTTKYITLPTINLLSYNLECQYYPNFQYCQKWGSFSLSNRQFNESLNEYKKQLELNKQAIVSTGNFWIILLEILKNNVFILSFFVFIIFIVCLSSIILKYRQR